jgi:hypothetical protein
MPLHPSRAGGRIRPVSDDIAETDDGVVRDGRDGLERDTVAVDVRDDEDPHVAPVADPADTKSSRPAVEARQESSTADQRWFRANSIAGYVPG